MYLSVPTSLHAVFLSSIRLFEFFLYKSSTLFHSSASFISSSFLLAGHGQCNCGRCDCKEGWAGKKCEHPLSCSLSQESSVKKCRGTSNLPCFGRGTRSSQSALVAMVTTAGLYFVLTSWYKIGHFERFTCLNPSLGGIKSESIFKQTLNREATMQCAVHMYMNVVMS